MNLYLDGISALERIKLSAQLPAEIGALTGAGPIQRVQIAGRIAAILEQLGQDAPAEVPAIELSGNEFGEFPDTPEGAAQRREAAIDHYMQQLVPSGGVFCQALQVKVQFNRAGAQKVESFGGDPRKVKLIAALPEIIAVGRKTSEEEPNAKGAKRGVVKVFVLKAAVNLEGQLIRARVLVRQMADGTYGYDHSVDRSEAAQVTGGIRGALDSVVSTENGRSVLLSDEASPGRDLHRLNQMIGEEGDACNVLDSVGGEVLNLFLDDEVVTEEPGAGDGDDLDKELAAAKANLDQYDKLINAGALSKEVLAALDRHRDAWMAVKARDESQAWEAGKARTIGAANSKAHTISAKDALTPAGAIKSDAKNSNADSAIWYYQGDVQGLAFTAGVTIGGEKSAGADRAAHILVRLRAAKALGYRLVNRRAGSLGTVWVLETPDSKAFVTRAGFEEMANAVFDRPVMPEPLPGYESMRAQQLALATAFLGWLDTLSYEQRHNQGVVARKISSTRIGQWLRMDKDGLGLFIQYVGADRQFGIRISGSDFEAMVAEARQIAVMPEIEQAVTPEPEAARLTAKGNPLIDEATLVDLGLIREVFGRWKYRYAVGAPELFASTKEGAIEQGSDAYAKADPSELLTKEQRWDKSNADFYADFDERYGKMSIEQVRAIMEAAKPDMASTLAAHGRESNNNGGRRTGPAVATQGAREGAELARQLERYLAERQAKESAGQVEPAPTGRAPAGGTIGMNGEHYKGGTFLPNTTLPKQGAAPGGTGGGLTGVPIEPGVRADAPGEGYKSIFNSYSQFIHVNDGIATVYDRPDVAIETFVNPDVTEGRAFLRAAAEAYNNGMRWFKPADIVVSDEHRKEPAHEIVEHVTKGGKGKTIRGIVRTDLSYAEAKAIDEYTFRKDGGYFIREKHLVGGATDIGTKIADLAARRDPEDPEAEMRRLEAAAQAHADRLANEQLRQQQKITQQVTKLRDVAASTLERAETELGRDRLANTARRAGMAASGIANAEASRAIALTMNNLADAIERGQAQHLAGITSRADVQTLSDSLRNGRYAYEQANNISHSERERRKHDPYTRDEAFYATYPTAKWDSAGASRARILEMIKGKRGAPAIANEIRYANEMTREQILALRNILGQKEVESNLGWWNVEQLARGERLRRAGIANTMQLREALTEFIEFKAGARAEDPIAKAERAIIGQKVGIDFFPTPSGEAKNMATLARIKPGDDVLEPSAGNGNLADAAKAAGANVDVIEISSQLRDILTAKGYNVVAHDFGSFSPAKQYDAILMNPPFSNRMDAEHIMRAFTMLKPGGHLVAIAGEGVFFGRDAKAVAFREWLDEHGAEVEALAGGTFKDTSLLATTGANARRIVLTR